VDDPVPPTPPHNGDAASTFDLPVDEVTCEEFVELVTEYFEGALPTRTLGQVEEHLVMCDWCVTYAEQMEALLAALPQLGESAVPEPPESVLVQLRGRRNA
jgi:predicted anti-sigma-YlaC factor YlaD